MIKDTKVCTFCKKWNAMVKCRDCAAPASCFLCTINKPTGGFCQDHLVRFIQVHWSDHDKEVEGLEKRF